MSRDESRPGREGRISRREMLGTVAKSAAAVVVAHPILRTSILPSGGSRHEGGGSLAAVNGVAGVDRVLVLPGKTYLRGWAGYGEPPRRGPRRPTPADSTPPAPTGPPPK